MKIAHIGPSNLPILLSRGGAIERRIVEMARVQAKRGHDVTVYSAESSNTDSIHEGYRLRAVKCGFGGRLRSLEFLRKAAGHLREHPVDIVHFHSMPEGIWFVRDSRALKILSYDYFRSRRWRYPPLFTLYRELIQKYDRLLPVSEFCLEESARFWNLPRGRMQVLYNGVNPEQFSPDNRAGDALRARLGFGEEPVVVYIGRVCEQKGTDVLIEAYLRLRERIPDVQLVVAGPVEQFGTARSSPLIDRIHAAGGHYLGAVDESDLAATYNLAAVYVLATRRDEMFGMGALEAQACGKPVVCSRQGGLPEVISQTSGMLFPVGDSLALASMLERVLTDSALYASLSFAARENALRFSWEAIASRLEEVCGIRGANC